jgi:hypothetical protein
MVSGTFCIHRLIPATVCVHCLIPATTGDKWAAEYLGDNCLAMFGELPQNSDLHVYRELCQRPAKD